MGYSTRMVVRTGLEILLGQLDLLAGRRVGLVSNPAAVLPNLISSVVALRHAGVNLVALFGMEHGFAGSAADGKAIASGVDARTGLPVFSLYGPTKEPTAAMLRDVDVLLYDAQDVGARFYTFISTLYYVLAAAGRGGRAVMVLDRPNPIGGIAVEGPLVEPGFESFVGIAPIPIRHGMTIGELARWFNAECHLGADLTVVEMQGWRRDRWFDETGLPWVPTSPAMPHLSTAIVYTGMCFLEGTSLSLGRGTALPFEQFGAPWVDAYELSNALNAGMTADFGSAVTGGSKAHRVAPAIFRPTSFEPAGNKYAGQICYGVQVHVTDRDALQPVRLGVYVLATLKRLFPEQFAWAGYPRADGSVSYHLDRLAGSAQVRDLLDAGASVTEITRGWEGAEATFCGARAPYLLYE